jgi:RNA polymerase sigma factor (sigma-70 family)
MTDVELLNQHRNGSESAFADIVRRHLSWVYGLACRRLGDSHLAEDVAQAVFILLHRKSPKFAADRAMMSWLYKTACYASDSAARGERRRHNRETKLAMQRPEAAEPTESPEWVELAPMLDRLIGQLSRTDREAILLRYYRGLEFGEIAQQIGVTPAAARKRTERAVEKLRQLAAPKGIPISTTSLAAGLAGLCKISVPPGLVATATTAATAPAGSAIAAHSTPIVKGALHMMATTKIAIGSVVAASFILTAGVIWGSIWMFADGQVQTDQTNGQSPTTAPATVSADAPFEATGPIPKLAPFSSIRWHGNVPEAQINGTWYEVVAVDGFTVEEILHFQKNDNDSDRHKHFAEDLVEVFSEMHHPTGPTVDLQVRTLDAAHTAITLQNVPMTQENRHSLMVYPADGQTTLFSELRWQDSIPQVSINGTWYDLVSVDRQTAARLIDSAKSAYGDDWQNQFQKSLMDVLNRRHPKDLYEVDLQLRTLDTHEPVTMSVRTPQPNQ